MATWEQSPQLDQWANFHGRLILNTEFPIPHQLASMLLSPLCYKCHCAPRQFPADDFKGLNVNKRLEFSIQRMEVRWNVVSKIHLDQ
jgi:hypothetical protein